VITVPMNAAPAPILLSCRPMRLRGGHVAGSVAATVALPAAAALASLAVAGGSYHGALDGKQSRITISLRVSSDGHRVTSVALSKLPIYCPGAPPPRAKISFQTARIAGDGTFTAKGRDAIAVGPLKGTPVATMKLTGMFAAGRREHGTLTTTFAGSAASKCSGHSSYSTKS